MGAAQDKAFFIHVMERMRGGSASTFISFLGWIIFGIGCYFFLKLQGVGLG
jgi:hypothetical protein